MRTLFRAAMLVLLWAASIPSAQARTLTVLHEFSGGSDGSFPKGGLIQDAAGNLYGTTSSGGALGEGTVYKIDGAGTLTTLFAFDGFGSGANPASALIRDREGNLYGIADEGPGGAGVVFKVSPAGQETLLFAFQGGLDKNPRVPTGGLLMDKAGNLYGTTLFGGNGNCPFGQLDFGCGTIFRLDPAGNLDVLYEFSGGPDGRQPFGPLRHDAAGSLYGVAQSGGDPSCPESQTGCGTVFKLSRDGKLTVLHTFQGGTDGASPQPGLLVDPVAGSLYGATGAGGNADHGTVFKVSSNGAYAVLHRFEGGKNGSTPNGSLISDPAGNLYGTTQSNDPVAVLGTVFALNPAGQFKVLHDFTGGLDGAVPLAGVIRDAAGHLFGTAFKNFLVNQQEGDVFEIVP